MKTIASRQNPWVKRLRDAIRDHASEIAIEGPKAVRDAVAGGWKPIAVITRGAGEGGVLPRDSLAFVPELFDSLSETRTSQGVIGIFERPAPASLFDDPSRLVVALDGVQDPGNVGAIVRLAAAFDCAGVALLPGCADPYGPKAIRASAGAILGVALAPLSVEELLTCGWPLFAADAGGTRTDPPARGAVIVLGNEGSGVSSEILREATTLRIPMTPRVESLNVAMSAAVLLAQAFKGRG